MNSDILRTGGMSFEQWIEANDLSKAPPEEMERFQSAMSALKTNAALKYILNGMEVEALSRVYTRGAEGIEDAHRDLQAVKRFRRILEAQVQDRDVALQKAKK
jgi:hypothetical protein